MRDQLSAPAKFYAMPLIVLVLNVPSEVRREVRNIVFLQRSESVARIPQILRTSSSGLARNVGAPQSSPKEIPLNSPEIEMD